MLINVGDIVTVTLPRGVLNRYKVLEVPGNNQVYWTLAPEDALTELTVVGPSFISMVKRA